MALVRSGDVQQRRREAAWSPGSPASCARSPTSRRVVSFYDSRNPAMVSRDRRSTYVVAYFKPRSDNRLKDDAQADRRTASPGRHDVTLGGAADRERAGRTRRSATTSRAPSCSRSRSSSCCRCCSSARSSRLCCRRCSAAWRSSRRSSCCGSSRASPTCRCSRSTSSPASGSGSRSTTACSWSPATARRPPSPASALDALRRTLQTAGRTILFSSLTVAAAVASLAIFPQRFLYSMGIAGALVALLAAAFALVVLPAVLAVLGPRVNALAPKRLQRAAERDARPAESGLLVPAVAVRDAPAGTDRDRQRGVPDRARDPVLRVSGSSRVDASVLPTSDERAPGRRRAPQRVPARPHRAARGRRRRARRLTAGQAPGRADRASAGRLGRRAGAAGRRSDSRCSTSHRGSDRSAHASQQLVHDVRAMPAPFYVGVAGHTAALRRPRAQPRALICRSCWRS